jgi:hypothetical protein
MAMGTSVLQTRIELIFRRCWNLITPWRSAGASPPSWGGLVNVRFCAHNRLIADIAPCPLSAKRGSRRTLFDHLVGAAKQRERYGNIERLRGLQVNNKFDLADLLDRQVGGLLALENAAGIVASQLV